jgi:hypothetical protein
MKKIIFLGMVLLIFLQPAFSQKSRERERVKNDTISSDSTIYELTIIDPGFDTWLVTQPPMNFYSNEYYAQKNRFYVSEWNRRYMSSRRKDLYQSYIDYNPAINYDINLNYRLYYYFRYFEEKNRVRLISRGK